MMKNTFIFLILSLLFSKTEAQVTLRKTENRWTLMVNQQPYKVKGVTFGFDKEVADYEKYCKDLKFLGVNTIRLWATNENTLQLLDIAAKYDIKILMGIWMRHGRPGMEEDDHFNYLEDQQGMEKMYDDAIIVVNQYKNHPAVLSWGIGNEVYLNTATDEEKVAYSKLLERICSQIKLIDTNHPITSVEAWTFGLEWWQKYVPSIDIYGLNCYGAGANLLAAELEQRNIDKPYIITEFGITGEWDIKATKNDIKIEPTDGEKYDAIANGYPNWIKNKPTCLGVFVFHYATGNEFMAPWLFTHFQGKLRPQYWAIREAFTGLKPINAVPIIHTFELAVNEAKSEIWVPITLDISDIENDALAFSFYYNQRTGSRKRRDQLNPLVFRGTFENGFEIKLPNENGPIKIYVTVTDTYNNCGIVSTAIIVVDQKAKDNKYLVPKVTLPFYVYKDGVELPYLPTAYMGNYKAMSVDTKNTESPHSGTSSLKITYAGQGDWFGLALVDPANDWGSILGGYDVSGAKTFSFWAKSNDSSCIATIGFGLIKNDKPFPDTALLSKELKLTTEWKKYTFKLKNLDLSCIRSGLVIFSTGRQFSLEIDIDDVMFE